MLQRIVVMLTEITTIAIQRHLWRLLIFTERINIYHSLERVMQEHKQQTNKSKDYQHVEQRQQELITCSCLASQGGWSHSHQKQPNGGCTRRWRFVVHQQQQSRIVSAGCVAGDQSN